jgi:DNA-binding MarR family transcriptional regulator
MFVSGYVYRFLQHETRRLGLRWTALMVLKDLDVLGSVSQRTLADIEQVRKPTMTVLLQQMEQQGWIHRTIDPDNRRVNLVTITSSGAKELRAAGKKLSDRLQGALEGLPKPALNELEAGLGQLIDLWMSRAGVAKE